MVGGGLAPPVESPLDVTLEESDKEKVSYTQGQVKWTCD